MIAITLAAFALIAPSLIAKTQTQANQVANLYQQGQVKFGQMMSVVYHYEGSVPLQIGLYNYGNSPITPLYVFVSTSQSNSKCLQACQCTWSLTNSVTLNSVSSVSPNTPIMLKLSSCSNSQGPLTAAQLTGIGTYQLFIYSTSELGYPFTL